ncbi:hypothetical protein [Solemya elarraichensis gill symbiont]|uniref:Thioredoxin domain-containing protein n=1 Tax=Solemya elarraichensis gill symbiont TaxID=1918949 RepID=A0A1T2LC57_9GAMM|nr:hypothetical protein [Solemya elarraichensis gill symbiont]OOZ42687.1 hypothetical protein BOW52_02045 [Solemya elarraichensis gill symbiont]
MMRCFSIALVALLLLSCSNTTPYPALQLSTYEGESIELDQNTPLTLLYFFSMSNPVSIGELYKLHKNILDEEIDIIAIAIQVDRPPNVAIIQRKLLIPIVIDNDNRISPEFGGMQLTPAIKLIKTGNVLYSDDGSIDYEVLNELIANNK